MEWKLYRHLSSLKKIFEIKFFSRYLTQKITLSLIEIKMRLIPCWFYKSNHLRHLPLKTLGKLSYQQDDRVNFRPSNFTWSHHRSNDENLCPSSIDSQAPISHREASTSNLKQIHSRHLSHERWTINWASH